MAFLHYRFVSLYCTLTWAALVVIVAFDVRAIPEALAILYLILTFMAAVPMKLFISEAEARQATGWDALPKIGAAGLVGLIYYLVARYYTPSTAALSNDHSYRLFALGISSVFYIFYVIPARRRLTGS